tara:strand:- start:3534 stop:4505 length:972 start_codon:yes stop_codon:yes gene_type:complete
LDKTDLETSNYLIPLNGKDWGTFHYWQWKNFKCHWRHLGSEFDQPILLLHGFGASSAHWRNNAGVLASSGYCVYSLDLIGFGDSQQSESKRIDKLDNKIWSNQVEAFINEVINYKQQRKVILIGNSLGGLTALTISAFKPELILALVAAPLPDPALTQSFIISWPKIILRIIKVFGICFFNLLPLELIIPLIAKTKLILFALQGAYYKSIMTDKELLNIVRTPARKDIAPKLLRAMCIGMSFRDIEITAPYLLKELTSSNKRPPFLLIWGEKDNFIPLNIGKNILKKFSWLKLNIFEKSGHCPHDETPEKFNKSILNWLNTLN